MRKKKSKKKSSVELYQYSAQGCQIRVLEKKIEQRRECYSKVCLPTFRLFGIYVNGSSCSTRGWAY